MSEEPGTSMEDDLLIGRLQAVAARVDPPPALLTEFVRAALDWRTLDAQLAELTYDSATDDALVDAVRGTVRAPRLLTFDMGETAVEFEVSAQGAQRRLVGQLVPMQPARIEIRHAEGVTAVETDEHGRFAADGIPAGPVSLRCRLGDGEHGRVLHTDWSAI